MAPSKRRLFWGVFCGSAMPLALACNQLIGLSDYDRVECNGGGVCNEAGTGETGTLDGPRDAPPDVPVVDASGTKKVQWPQFRMPNYAQDGGPAGPLATYSAATGGGLLDSVSNLVWQETALPGLKTYEDAEKACAAVGGGTWRIPSRVELVTLLDLTTSKPIKIDSKFLGTESAEYWTSSEVRPDINGQRRHWTVDFQEGGLKQKPIAGGQAGVRCIKDRP